MEKVKFLMENGCKITVLQNAFLETINSILLKNERIRIINRKNIQYYYTLKLYLKDIKSIDYNL